MQDTRWVGAVRLEGSTMRGGLAFVQSQGMACGQGWETGLNNRRWLAASTSNMSAHVGAGSCGFD